MFSLIPSVKGGMSEDDDADIKGGEEGRVVQRSMDMIMMMARCSGSALEAKNTVQYVN